MAQTLLFFVGFHTVRFLGFELLDFGKLLQSVSTLMLSAVSVLK